VSAYVISQFRRRPWRVVGVVAGVALGAALYLLIAALGNGFRLAAQGPLRSVGADLVVSRPASASDMAASGQRTRGIRLPFGLGLITPEEVADIRADDGLSAWAVGLQVWDFGPNRYTTVLGLDPAQAAAGPGRVLAGSIMEGRSLLPGDQGTVVVDQHYALFYQVKPGARVTIGGESFRVVGIAALHDGQAAAANLYIPLDHARVLAGVPAGAVNQVYLKAADASQVDSLTARLTERTGDLDVLSESSLLRLMDGIGRISARFAAVAASVALVGGLVLAWAVVGGLVSERRREIGLMQALGWRRQEVVRAFLVETLLISVAGCAAGVLLGHGAAWALGQLPMPSSASSVHQVLSSLHGAPAGLQAVDTAADLTFPAQTGLAQVLLSVVTVVPVGVVAGWTAVRRLLRVQPAQAVRSL
jgi:putative ABC transport system permease protein